MKTKTDYFTKFITFCVLSLFLITNMILFTSCDNGNSPNNNTNEEQNNTQNTDYCEICDGVQDKNHQHDYCGDETCLNKDKTSPDHEHDYCNDCGGNQTDPKHTCTVVEPTLSAEVKSIGNGTYSIANFMVNDNADDSIDKKVADGLECAEKYIKGVLDSFTPEFQAKYSEKLALITDENAFNQSTTSGFDFTINRLNDSCAPIFEEIIENIDDDLDVAYFKNEYKGLCLKTYKDASGNYFDGNSAQDTYNTKKDSLNKAWAMMHALNGKVQQFSIVEDIENNNCTETTSHMDDLLLKHDIANDLGISNDDLKNFINLSLTITSLDAMHDYATAKGYSKHVITYCDGLDNELTKL